MLSGIKKSLLLACSNTIYQLEDLLINKQEMTDKDLTDIENLKKKRG
jgi:hypothetical protein